MHMTDTVIRAGIAYSFSVVPYSLPALKKLDKKLIALQKKICGLPNCMPNITTQLPHESFSMQAFSLQNAYLRCIGEQLKDALNDTGKLGIIYRGLTHFILATYGGALNIPRLTSHDCIRSPITRTLYLFKTAGGIHLQSTLHTFLLLPTSLETNWLAAATSYPHLSQQFSLKLLNKLLLHHIIDLHQIILPNGTHLMDHNDFKTYYDLPTKLIKTALKTLELLFCHPTCLPQCPIPCNQHHLPRTLLPQYLINIPPTLPNQRPTLHPLPSHPLHPLPPRFILNNLTQFPILNIIDHKEYKLFDTNKIVKKYTSYLCQWILPNQQIYNKWLPQHKLLPWNVQNTPTNTIPSLIQYYTQKHYRTLILKHFLPTQPKDTRYISPALSLPLIHLSILECNPDKDILTPTPTIQLQHENAHIYDHNGTHLITIPATRLNWLWLQYHTTLHNSLIFTPPIQSFETKIAWLYQRYKYRIPKHDPSQNTQYTLPTPILNHIFSTFNITHSYFSSPLTCPTSIHKLYSSFPRDKIFGSLGTSFQYRWHGLGYAHPHDINAAQQTLHWARLAASTDPNNITLPNNKWYDNLAHMTVSRHTCHCLFPP
jgi:hypothetical protein